MSKKYRYWLDFWALSHDPFTEEPLLYTEHGFDKLLVRYRPIEEVDNVLDEILKQKGRIMRRRYYIIGHRGMGKTTLYNYVMRTLLEKRECKCLPIYVNNAHIRDPEDVIDPSKDSEKLRLNFCLRTIEAIFNMVLHTLRDSNLLDKALVDFFTERRRRYYDLKGRVRIDQSTAEDLLKEYLDQLRRSFEFFFLMYDELDKIDDYNIVLRFLRASQGLLESLSGYGCVIFISGVPEFRDMLYTSEYSGVSGYEISIKAWLPKEARLLIESRLRHAMLKGVFPFADDVIKELCSKAEGRPRFIQRQARDALVWAAYRGTKKIDSTFTKELFWKDESKTKFLEAARTSNELDQTIKILQRTYNPDRDDPTLYFLLTHIFKSDRLFKLSPSELRRVYGLDIGVQEYQRLLDLLEVLNAIKRKTTPDGKEYFIVCKDIKHLFEYVTKTLGESLEYLPRVVRLQSAEIRLAKEEFNLRQETLKIINMDPERKFKKTDIIKQILKNLDAKTRGLRYYGVSSERELKSKLKSGLTQVLIKLCREGFVTKLLIGRYNVYKWSTKLVDLSFLKGLRLDDEVLRNVESSL